MSRPRALTTLALMALAALYGLLPATVFRGDGMAYAVAIREGGAELLNPNHLAYGVVSYTAWRLLGLAGLGIEPIRCQQLLGAATAVLCLALFHGLLLSLHVGRRAAVFSACLAFTAGFWLQAISPETFGLSMLLEVLVFRAATAYLRAPRSGPAALLGAAWGLAILGTQVDLLLGAVMIRVVAASPAGARRKHGILAAVVALVLAGAGFGAAACAAGVGQDRLLTWWLGRAAGSSYFGFDLVNIARDAKNLVQNLFPSLSRLAALAAGEISAVNLIYAALVLAGGVCLLWTTLAAANRVRALDEHRRVMFQAIGIYLVLITGFFTIWANYLSEFWANHWVCLWAVLALGARAADDGESRAPAPLLLMPAVLCVLGIAFLAVPLAFSEEGRLTSELRHRVRPDDPVLVTWDEEIGRPTGALWKRAQGSSMARSTFAVNLETYLGRPVQSIGCWHEAGAVRCLQTISAEGIEWRVRESVEAGGSAWLLQVSATYPREGLADPGLVDRLLQLLDARLEFTAGGDGALGGAVLYRLAPARDESRFP